MSNEERIKSQLIFNVLDLGLKYGVPYVRDKLREKNKEYITQEDIDNLKIDAEWSNYFPEDSDAEE